MGGDLFLKERNPASGRHAVLEDDGTCAWLYLTEPNGNRPVADVWVYNRVPAPRMEQVASYRPSPPPAAIDYVSEAACLASPLKHRWHFLWSRSGDAVVLFRDDEARAFLLARQKHGYSRLLERDGPWGLSWSNQVYAAEFSV
jgi:hypothetical protein